MSNLFLTRFVPTVIIAFYTISPLRNFIASVFSRLNLNIAPWMIGIIILVFVLIIPALLMLVKNKNLKYHGGEEKLLKLSKYIDDILDAKATPRSGCEESDEDIPSSSSTAPNPQLGTINRTLAYHFRDIYKDITINSVLFHVYYENGKSKLIDQAHVEPLSSSMDAVNNPKSTAQTAIKNEDLVIVQNTRKKTGNYISEGDDKNFSILCYPIIIKAKVKHVISLTSRVKNKFKNSDEKNIRFILERFEKTLKLEHYMQKPVDDLKSSSEIATNQTKE